MGSRAPGGVVLVTFAETKVTRGAGRSNPQLAFKVKSRQAAFDHLMPGSPLSRR